MNNQGANSIDVFHGKGKASAIKLFYAGSAPLFANIIQNNLRAGSYSLADLGGHKGELLGDILALIPQYQFDSVIIDRVAGLDEKTKAKKIVADIVNSGLQDKSFDVVIMRYVLPWDAYERQKLILKEVQRVCKGFAIIQHQGAPNNNPKTLQEASMKLWSGVVPVLKREHGFFTEASQVENWMTRLGIKFEKIEEKYIETLSELFIEKFELNSQDAQTTKDILKNCDGITVTTWILRF